MMRWSLIIIPSDASDPGLTAAENLVTFRSLISSGIRTTAAQPSDHQLASNTYICVCMRAFQYLKRHNPFHLRDILVLFEAVRCCVRDVRSIPGRCINICAWILFDCPPESGRAQWDWANSAFYFDIFITLNEPLHPFPALSSECEPGLERK